MNTNWSKWSAIAEIISSIAILVTLIYLSIQTQQNTAAIQANTRQTMITTDVETLKASMDYPHAFVQMRNTEALSEDEKNRIISWLIMLVRTREYQWFQYKNGLLDKQAWEAYLTGLSGNLSYPRTRGWWNQDAYDLFDHEFVDEVNKYLAGKPVIKDFSFHLDPIETSSKP